LTHWSALRMTSSATTTESGSASTRCPPTAPAMESSANCMTRPRNRFVRLSRTHLALARRRKSATSTNHLWIPMPSRPEEFHQSLMTSPPLMELQTCRNSSPSWLASKCAESAASLGQLSIPMRWIPTPTFSTSAKVVCRCPMSLTIAKNSSPRFVPPLLITSPRCAHLSESPMALMSPQRFSPLKLRLLPITGIRSKIAMPH